jgi:hypothetical protein
MGIIINDSLTLQNGLVVSNVYASLSGEPISVIKGVPYLVESNAITWFAASTYNIWATKDAADKKLPYVQQDFVRTNIDPSQPVIPDLYEALKAKYQSTTDC